MKNRSLPIIFVFIVAFVFLFLSYIPNIYEASVTNLLPPDRVMLWGEHIYTYDYNVYLSKIRQGTEGRWTVVDKYDNNTKNPGVFLQMLYLLSGKLGGLLQLTPTLTYHFLRTILSVAWVLTIIYLCVFYLRKPGRYIIGVLLALVSSSFPIFYQFQNSTWVGQYMDWWQEMDPMKHISYIPHYLLNYIILAVLIVLMYVFTKTRQNKYFIVISILTFFSFLIHPSGGTVFLISWAIYHFINALIYRSYNKKQFLDTVFKTVILFLVALIPLLYIKVVTSTYPWKSLTDFDQNYHLPFSLNEYLLALGPVIIPGFLGVILVILKREEKLLALATWVLAAFLGIIVFGFIPAFAVTRFVQTANQIPLAILATYFIFEFVKKFRNRFLRLIVYLYLAFIILDGLAQCYFSLKAQTGFIHERAVAVAPLVPYPSQVMYPLKDFYNALIWLKNNTKITDVILTKVTAGNYIPAYAGNFVYLGHSSETPQFNDRVNQADQFFSGEMDNASAKLFLKTNNIAYVFFGPQEKDNNTKDIGRYSFLKTAFSTPYVTLFKVLP